MSFRWVESFGENDSYIKCLVPEITYNSLSEMITDFQANGITVDNLGVKEKTSLSDKTAPNGEFTLANGNKYINRTGTQWSIELFLKEESSFFANAGGYSPYGRFITIALDDDVHKAVIFGSYPTSKESTSAILNPITAVRSVATTLEIRYIAIFSRRVIVKIKAASVSLPANKGLY